MAKRRKKTQSISRRLARSTLVTTLVVLLFLCSAVLLSIQQSYYGSVRSALEDAANNPNAPVVFSQTNSGGHLLQSDVSMLNTFIGQNRMTVWYYDASGKVILSSDGTVNENTPIPEELGALTHMNRAGITRLPSNEQVMTLTTQLADANNNHLGSVRYMISLQPVNQQLMQIAAILMVFLLIALVIILMTGAHFVRTLLTPIEQLADTAEKISLGDLKARVPSLSHNDEFALLGVTVNAMADCLEESNRLKNDFISTISHELRTPLTAIRGWSETLQQMGVEDEAALQRGLGIILSESTRLEKMVEELLDFSRVQSGRMTLRSEPLDILAELDEVVFAIKETALRAGVSVRQKVPEYPARLHGDAYRLRQVFINIIENAVKYNSPGGLVEIEAQPLSSKQMKITVEDNGCGIPEEHLYHVKDKFYKADSVVRGSGIGLAVADEIIRLHGGTLEIGSAAGKGTLVTITLPLDEIIMPELPGEIISFMEAEQRSEDGQ